MAAYTPSDNLLSRTFPRNTIIFCPAVILSQSEIGQTWPPPIFQQSPNIIFLPKFLFSFVRFSDNLVSDSDDLVSDSDAPVSDSDALVQYVIQYVGQNVLYDIQY